MARDLDILILAAGRGSRMGSDIPKVLHPLLGDPLIRHVIDAALELSPREIGVIVGHARQQVKSELANYDLTFVLQRDQKGTGHAVRCADKHFAGRKGHVMILSGDVPLMRGSTLKSFFQHHKKSRLPASLITASLDHPGSLGRVVRDARGRVERIVEARDADFSELAIREINSGIYLFRNADLFEGLRKLKLHRGSGEYYLTDVIKMLATAGRGVHAESIADPFEALGINTGTELLSAQETLRRRIALEHASRGVEFIDPSSTFVGKGVTIGAGTVVWPFSVIQGGVSIGARCRIGPFAHLRPGSVIEDGAQVGSFVEVKNSRLGRDSMAKHLAFIGDADIGAGVNVGAGAVTANFDGKRIHRTEIGDGAFIGSGSVLVAPAKVGEHATVGAGAVVPKGHEVSAHDTVVGVPAVSTANAKAKKSPVVKTAGKKAKTKAVRRKKSS
ncbi:MAG: NTP transferase domain-containing protein [Planctomycetota bacterium]